MSDTMQLDLSELVDLQRDLDKMANSYPDEADKSVQKLAKQLRREAKKASPIGERKRSANAKIRRYNKTLGKGERKRKRKKHLRNQWKIDYKGVGADTVAMIYSKAPHYHLVERGHMLVTPKGPQGFVSGSFFFRKTATEFENSGKIEKEAMDLLSKLEEKGGFK